MDHLCRNLREHLPMGWGVGPQSDWNAIRALAGWCSQIEVTGSHPELSERVETMAKELHDRPPPRGWLPENTNDLLLTELFRRHWKDGHD
jgi:hypothetical protein